MPSGRSPVSYTHQDVYKRQGRKWWEGTKDDNLHADNPELNDFVFGSAMAKKAKLAAK